MIKSFFDECSEKKGTINKPVLFCPYCGEKLALLQRKGGQLIFSLNTHINDKSGATTLALLLNGKQVFIDPDANDINLIDSTDKHNPWSKAGGVQLTLTGDTRVSVSPAKILEAVINGEEFVEVVEKNI